VKKNQLNRLEFFKNQPVWFGFDFISLKLKKPNRTQTRKKPSQTGTGKNRVKQKKTEPNQTKPESVGLNRFFSNNQTETGRFEPVSVRFWFF
jgi:hypothetical protein